MRMCCEGESRNVDPYMCGDSGPCDGRQRGRDGDQQGDEEVGHFIGRIRRTKRADRDGYEHAGGRQRSRSYGLVGGVAEYGSALYLSADDQRVDLRSDGERDCLNALRTRLAATPGVELDDAYRFGIRARVAKGPIPAALLEDLADLLGGIRTIHGDGQTDFAAARIDKGTGLDALRIHLADDAGCEPELLFAVGDTESDRPMLRRARDGAVPAHATTGPGSWRRTAAPYQAGLGEAIDAFVGHGHRRPGTLRRAGNLGCELCRLAPFSREREALVALLSASESGRSGLLPKLLVAIRLGRTGRPNRRG